MLVGAAVPHHANGLHWQDHREGLPDRVIQTGLADLVDIDRIRLTQDIELRLADRAGATNGKSGPGNG